MAIPTQLQALATDAAALWSYEFRGYVRQGGVTVPALVTDSASTAVDAYGGADPVDVQRVMLLATDWALLSLTEGDIAYTSVNGTVPKERKKIVVSFIESPDQVSVDLLLRAA